MSGPGVAAAAGGSVVVAVVGREAGAPREVARTLAAELSGRGVAVALVDAAGGGDAAIAAEVERAVKAGAALVLVGGGESSTYPMVEVVSAAAGVAAAPLHAPVPGRVLGYVTDGELPSGLPTFLHAEVESLGDYLVHLYMGGKPAGQPRI